MFSLSVRNRVPSLMPLSFSSSTDRSDVDGQPVVDAGTEVEGGDPIELERSRTPNQDVGKHDLLETFE